MNTDQQIEKVETTLLTLGKLLSKALDDVRQLKDTGRVPSKRKQDGMQRQADLMERIISGKLKPSKLKLNLNNRNYDTLSGTNELHSE